MSRMMPTLAAALLLLPGLASCAADDAAAVRTTEGLDAFRAYLKEHYPDKTWETGPARLDSPAVRAAYCAQRFYYVFSQPPVGPGALSPDLQGAFQRRAEEFRKTHLSLTVRVDEEGKVTPLAKGEDFNAGLMKVADDADARTAAAAILSLYSAAAVGPTAVGPEEVRVTRGDKGWSCRVDAANEFQGFVTFDAGGRCAAASKFSTRPQPP